MASKSSALNWIGGEGNLIHLTADANYSFFHTRDGKKHLFAQTLKYFGRFLPGFVRCHRHHLVNPDYVKSIHYSGDTGTLVLVNGTEVPISRRKIWAVKRQFNRRRQMQAV